MSQKVKALKFADTDIEEIIDYYNFKTKNQAKQLLEELYSFFQVIGNNPRAFKIIFKKLRVCSLEIFPYNIH